MPQLVVSWIATALVNAGVFSSLAVATAVVQFAMGIVLSAVRQALTKDQTPQVKRQLAAVTERPAYRTVYGWDRAVGTPAPRRVKNDKIVACYILNSYPSFLPAGTTKLFLDDRQVYYSGDPFNFAGPGALANSGDFSGLVRFWIGRGDQTTVPPTIIDRLSEADEPGYGFKSTDVWRGRTILWAIFDAGDDDDFQETWPSNSPTVEVEGQWSYVWNPNDPAQNPNDRSTWKWHDNQAVCLLDALRNNPIAPYSDTLLMMDTFRVGANYAQQGVAKKDGTFEPRYRVGGTIIWNADKEIEDQIEPLLLAGASSLIRVGGRLGMKPGVWLPPTRTITDVIDNEFEISPHVSSEDLPTELRFSYMSKDRGYEPAELKPYTIPGAQARNGGMRKVRSVALEFVQSATQAMRIKWITINEAQRKRNIRCTYPPKGFTLTVGENHTLALPGPLGTAVNGVYEVTSMDTVPIEKEDGVALRTAVTLLEVGPEIWAYNPQTQEEEIEVPPKRTEEIRFGRPSQPTAMGYEIGSQHNLNTGTTIIPRARWWFVRHTNDPESTRYEWEWRVLPSGQWTEGGEIVTPKPDELGRIYSYLNLDKSSNYAVRVRGRTRFFIANPSSLWREITINRSTSTGSIAFLSATVGLGSVGDGQVRVSGTMSSNAAAAYIRLYRGAWFGAFSTADLIHQRAQEPGTSFNYVVSGVREGPARFWLVPVASNGTEGPESGPFSLNVL